MEVDCSGCKHWKGESMYKGSPCALGCVPGCCTVPDLCPAPSAPAVEWTSEPPNEPGWYWTKLDAEWDNVSYHEPPTPRRVDADNLPTMVAARTWWPVPISEPPKGGTKK
jgi:hypothetical protein